MTYFNNKTVWVTGASSGIGEALVKALAKQNANVVLSARRVAELERVAREAGLSENNSLLLPLDLNEYGKAQEWVDAIQQKFDKIDVVIHNGGVSQRGLAADTEISVDESVLNINLRSPIAITKALLPQMLQRNSGHIVAISSILADFGLALHSTYAASKHGLEGFFESLREEVKFSNIDVTVLSPGFIKTNVARNALTEDGSKYAKNSPAQEKGMETSVFARKALRAISKSKRHQYIGGYEIMAVYVQRYFPKLFYRLMTKKPKG